MLDYKITPITKSDAYTINKTLIKELKDKRLFKKITMHIRKGIAIKLTYGGKIAGFCLIKEFQGHFSLSYYYIYEEYRAKIGSMFFFFHCLSKMKNKPIYVQKNKNYEMYKRYFKNISEEGIIQFKGLREDSEWAELLKQSKMS